MARKPVKKVAPKAAPKATPDDAQFYGIEKIVNSRESADGQPEYLIKWKDFPESHNSWQSINDLFCKRESSPSATPHAGANVKNFTIRLPSVALNILRMNVDEKVPAAVPVQKEQRDDDNDNNKEHDEPSPKRQRSNRRGSASKALEPKATDEQQEKKQPAKKRGRAKLNENVRTEQDSTMEAEPQQLQPKKRRQPQKSVPAKIDEEQSGSDDDADAAAACAAANDIAERAIYQVENMRKRNNRHEYLVATMDGNAEWIGRERMVREHAPLLIAFFERITRFR